MLIKKINVFVIVLTVLCSCAEEGKKAPRLALFIGVDISGSFVKGPHFDDSLDFLAYYIYGHLNGVGDLEVPHSLFISSIGGGTTDEPKTFYPIQTFQHKSIAGIRQRLDEIFPRTRLNRLTDYNAFFQQIALHIRNKKLLLRPISIVMLSDGIPDIQTETASEFDSILVKPLETLSRNVTLRLLYTDAVVGTRWQNEVKRKRVKIWTQDAAVMRTWRDPDILQPDIGYESQERFFAWLEDNVNFGVRARSIN